MEFGTRSTGFTEKVENFKDRVPDYDPRSGNHLWISILMYKVDPANLLKGELALFDHESLLSVNGPGCFFCEEVFSPYIATRRCKGEPK